MTYPTNKVIKIFNAIKSLNSDAHFKYTEEDISTLEYSIIDQNGVDVLRMDGVAGGSETNRYPSVTSLNNETFVVSYSKYGNAYDLYLKFFDNDGNFLREVEFLRRFLLNLLKTPQI